MRYIRPKYALLLLNLVLWVRSYELDTNRPIYVGRDSRMHHTLTEIEIERRTGYGYVGTWSETLLTQDYSQW